MAIKPWELGLAIAVGAGFFYFMWRVRSSASPEKLRGQVQEVRRKGLWALEAGRLLIIRHDTHRTPMVGLQFRKPGAVMNLRLTPQEAIRIASHLREAAKQVPFGEFGAGNSFRT